MSTVNPIAPNDRSNIARRILLQELISLQLINKFKMLRRIKFFRFRKISLICLNLRSASAFSLSVLLATLFITFEANLDFKSVNDLGTSCIYYLEVFFMLLDSGFNVSIFSLGIYGCATLFKGTIDCVKELPSIDVCKSKK